MGAKEQKTKEQKAKAAMAGGRARKKKWSKGKTKENANRLVVIEQELYDKIEKEVPKYKLITTSILIERMGVNGSVARRCIQELAGKGLIRPVSTNSSQLIYTRATTQ